ncbi:uncharacterized protein LOC115631757 [Scaptodrosophila lebanonensis]|uniref:Uncharacterized protein LOC115631757 n=1 Tax=Drosophila lebanonensis TaxID=7225 RepID=A0A6J2UAH9_DROLE|nr:uncharacterized protein LOC115631757 [Scaptodrosophila lebanonensis]
MYRHPTRPPAVANSCNRRSGTLPDDENWGSSSGPSRATSNERETSQSRKNLSSWQSKNKTKPPLHRQSTEEFDFEDAAAENAWRGPTSASPEQRLDSRRQPDTRSNVRTKPKLRSTDVDRARSESVRRPVTPVLRVNPDAQPAVPMPRTPMRLKSKVSLTARAMQDIVNKRSQRLQRTGTDDYDLEESETYGTGGHFDDAVAA